MEKRERTAQYGNDYWNKGKRWYLSMEGNEEMGRGENEERGVTVGEYSNWFLFPIG